MKTGSGYAIRRHSESTGETYFYSATKGKTGVIVRTAAPYSVSLTESLQADYGFTWVHIFIGVMPVHTRILRHPQARAERFPAESFRSKAERGERISDIEPFPHDELGEISHNIVRLYARLQQTASERDRQHRAALHEQKEKERIKKQLTNNINHELKTPVASIRICIETLLCHEGTPQEKRRDFLERCMADTDRLARLLEDVSILTRMDDGAASISKTGIDLAATIREAADEQRPAADAKRIAIYCSVGDGITIEGNPALLESIFRNLIANAISYSGGTEITIKGDTVDARTSNAGGRRQRLRNTGRASATHIRAFLPYRQRTLPGGRRNRTRTRNSQKRRRFPRRKHLCTQPARRGHRFPDHFAYAPTYCISAI